MPSDAIRRQVGSIESLTSEFTNRLQRIIGQAQASITAQLQQELIIEQGVIQNTAGNRAVLRRFSTMFMETMDRAGYGTLVEAFVGQFPGQFQYFQQVIQEISETIKTPLARFEFSQRDLALFSSQQLSADTSLRGMVSRAAELAQQQSLFSVGGLPFRDLTSMIADRLSVSLGDATTLAGTSLSTFYRGIAARGFEIIERDSTTTEEAMRYRYEGPVDKLIRPFCARLMKSQRTYTREQITDMRNGQLPNPFVTGGGYNCRHQWIIQPDKEQMTLQARAGARPWPAPQGMRWARR